ncbi:MAG: hypothetical protein V4574_12475 [Pseudomonadota bacterium]
MKRLIESALPVAALLCAAPACAQDWSGPPAPPAGAARTQVIPPQDGLGRYATPNQGLSPHEVTWHFRAALNVAALGCRDFADAGMADAYNRMLTAEARPLAAADAGVKAQYRARHGGGWEAAHDRAMTRLYNYFAQPPAHTAFCAAARDILAQGEGLSPIEFPDFAAWALPRLDAPFTDFYRAFEAWQAADAAWRRQGSGAPVEVAAAIPPPSGMIVP